MAIRAVATSWFVAALIAGCAFTPPYVGQGPHPQIRRGAPVPPVDLISNVLSLPGKVILWNWRFSNHAISAQTEDGLVRYLEAKQLPVFEQTIYRLNEYAPLGDLRALIKNRHVGWPYRLLIGLPITLLYDVLLPGRLFGWGDYYNPYTNVVHLYSDDVAIALHEAGHAYDFADFPYRGTYGLLRIIPFTDLYQEWWASENAVTYFVAIGDRAAEFQAYRTLWPAYGTYAGSYLPLPFGSAAGALIGHVASRVKVASRKRYYQRMDAALQAPNTTLNQLRLLHDAPRLPPTEASR